MRERGKRKQNQKERDYTLTETMPLASAQIKLTRSEGGSVIITKGEFDPAPSEKKSFENTLHNFFFFLYRNAKINPKKHI
jgi:hypothetical protein